MDTKRHITPTHTYVFTCYELECPVFSRWISTDPFLDVLGGQVKQIQVIFHRKNVLEAIFETNITYTPRYNKKHELTFIHKHLHDKMILPECISFKEDVCVYV